MLAVTDRLADVHTFVQSEALPTAEDLKKADGKTNTFDGFTYVEPGASVMSQQQDVDLD